jgi:tRNA(Phe) wybutosine-synthesizing methylase Tyw3
MIIIKANHVDSKIIPICEKINNLKQDEVYESCSSYPNVNVCVRV